MMKGSLALVGFFLVVEAAHAHPHDSIEQQAALSIGSDVAVLHVRIVPSYAEGGAIHARIDENGDGSVSDDEAYSLGRQVVSRSRLEVDGDEVAFMNLKVDVPDFERTASGLGVIEIKADASIDLGSRGKHDLAFEIVYEEFSDDWFIQPFLYPDLNETMPPESIVRSKGGRRVEILFSPGDEASILGGTEE